jgi:acetyl-CoA carboxylase carboxyltransferase component
LSKTPRRKGADGDPAPAPPAESPLDAVRRVRAAALDEARPEAVAKRRAQGRLTARASIAAFLDPDSFVEIGRVAKPARDDMAGAADGVVMGHGLCAGRPVAVMAYDYTVHAGTQSAVNHLKTDRIFALAAERRWPVVGWFEGGGARPHDFSVSMRGDTHTFVNFARLSGLVPTIGIVGGRCFAGNANLAGLSDVLIATESATIGMAGPALVQQALGFTPTPEEIGPVQVHVEAGAVDIVVRDDAAAARMARRVLGFFPHAAPSAPAAFTAPDTGALRGVVPADPAAVYNVRRVLDHLFDRDSIQELRPRFGGGIVTAFARLEGIAVGVLASQPAYLGGAIDSPSADKAARFVQLCDAHDIPMVILADTPGLMVGPAVERTGLVRHSARLLVALANATTPFLTVVLRRAYGLGYYVMGSKAMAPALLLAWPTAEFGGMGLEGAAALIWKRELEAIADAEERARELAAKTAFLMRQNTALEVGGRFEYDDVIDPAETRGLLARTLRALPPPAPRQGRKRTVDTW